MVCFELFNMVCNLEISLNSKIVENDLNLMDLPNSVKRYSEQFPCENLPKNTFWREEILREGIDYHIVCVFSG